VQTYKYISVVRMELSTGQVKIVFLFGVILVVLISGCTAQPAGTGEGNGNGTAEPLDYEGKKILYIDSYHEGYEWSDGITRGVQETLKDTGVELKIHRMDTKRNPSDEFKEQAALDAKVVIEEFDPDVVIASDDNAMKYLIMPYYRDADLPVVFCGLNWDASLYDLPYNNTAGMVEVALIPELIEHLKIFSDGERLGYLSADILTERKNLEYYDKLFGINFTKVYLVTTMEEWKDAFLNLQDEVDMVIFENNAGITDWDSDEAEAFALNNTGIPFGTTNPWVMQSSLIGLTKVPEEQGEWSAQTALRILEGEKPSDIPIVTNEKGKLMLNLKIAEKLGVVFTPLMLRNADSIIGG